MLGSGVAFLVEPFDNCDGHRLRSISVTGAGCRREPKIGGECADRSCPDGTCTRNGEPGLAVGPVQANLANRQTSLLAFSFDPAETVMNATGHIGLVARSVPRVAVIVRTPVARGQVAREKRGVVLRVAQEGIQHGANLFFARMSPDRVGEEEVELLAENRRIEVAVGMETRPLELPDFRFENRIDPHGESLRVRLNPAIAERIEEMDEPISHSQDTTTQIDELGLRG